MPVAFIKNSYSALLYGNSATFVMRIFMGMIFLLSGVYSSLYPVNFGKLILLYDVVPVDVVPYGAVTIPLIETAAGLLLLAGFRIRASALLAAILLIIYTAAISVNLARGRVFDCGCLPFQWFGLSINEDISPWLLVRNAFFLFFVCVVFRAEKHLFSIDSVIERTKLERM